MRNSRRYTFLAILIVLFAFSSPLVVGQTAKPVLEKGDVERFIETFPKLKVEFEKFDVEMDAEKGTLTYNEALQASAEFRAILKKYGWDENFLMKTTTIIQGVVALTMKDAMKASNPDMERAKKAIESNPNISESMKKQLLSKLGQGQAAMGGMGALQSLNPADLALIKIHIKELKEMLDDEKS
ncbi:hypothetical protein ACFLT9_12015 [Acidobacteriota bacterium]